jgi:hypothetical protein
LADSGGAAEAEVNLTLSEDFGQKEALSFVKGAGVLEPQAHPLASTFCPPSTTRFPPLTAIAAPGS